MKKTLLTTFVLGISVALFLVTQTGCKKETETITTTDTVYHCTPNIQGLWIGDQRNATSGQPFSMSIKPDGTMSYENKIGNTYQLCVGTWTLINNNFSGTTTCVYGVSAFVGVTQNFTATYNSTTGAMTNGTWRNVSPNNDSGTFTLSEIN